MIRVCDRVVMMDRDSDLYMRSLCVIGINGDRVALSGCGREVECNIGDVLPYDTFLAIIGHGVEAKERLVAGVARADEILRRSLSEVSRCVIRDAEFASIDADIACSVLEVFFDMLPYLGKLARILSERGAGIDETLENYYVHRARDEISKLMRMMIDPEDSQGDDDMQKNCFERPKAK